jgi:hypothetical protein
MRLLQPGPAFAAGASVDVTAQMFPARGAAPVHGCKPDERGDEYGLGRKETLRRELSENIRPLLDHCGKQNQKERYRDRYDLAGLTLSEFISYPDIVSFSHQRLP